MMLDLQVLNWSNLISKKRFHALARAAQRGLIIRYYKMMYGACWYLFIYVRSPVTLKDSSASFSLILFLSKNSDLIFYWLVAIPWKIPSDLPGLLSLHRRVPLRWPRWWGRGAGPEGQWGGAAVRAGHFRARAKRWKTKGVLKQRFCSKHKRTKMLCKNMKNIEK